MEAATDDHDFDKEMDTIDKSDTFCEIMVAIGFIVGFGLAVKHDVSSSIDANTSSLLVAGVSIISDYLSDRYKSSLDTRFKRILPKFSLALLTFVLIILEWENFELPVTCGLLDIVMMVTVLLHLIY
jgi:hypothetical protein